MHTRVMMWEGHLPEASPEQSLLCLGSITTMRVCQVEDLEEEPFFILRSLEFLLVSPRFFDSSYLSRTRWMQWHMISLWFFLSYDHPTSHQSLLFALCYSGFHLTIHIINSHLTDLWSAPFFFVHQYFPCLCWKITLMLSWDIFFLQNLAILLKK